MPYYAYILSNNAGSVLYAGVTADVLARTMQHRKKKEPKSFTARYNVTRLVYYEDFDDALTAIAREKQIKGGSRAKKLALIGRMNPEWRDLYDELLGP